MPSQTSSGVLTLTFPGRPADHVRIGLQEPDLLVVGRSTRRAMSGQVIRLRPGEPEQLDVASLGLKAPASQLLLQLPGISRLHALIERRGPELRVTNISAHGRNLRVDNDPIASGRGRTLTPGRAAILCAPESGEPLVSLALEIESHRAPSPRPLPTRHPGDPSQLLPLLPELFQDQDFLRRYLLIVEEIWEPFEWRMDHLNASFDPRLCPRRMLPTLAAWLGAEAQPSLPEPLERRFVRDAWRLQRDRGTARGLRALLEVTSGLDSDSDLAIALDESGPAPVLVLRVTAPSGDPEALERTSARLRHLLERHCPAHLPYTLEVSPHADH